MYDLRQVEQDSGLLESMYMKMGGGVFKQKNTKLKLKK